MPSSKLFRILIAGALFTATAASVGATTIPGKIEAEAYAAMAGVQLENCSEGTQNVGWIDTGDWMAYAITVPTTGSYNIQYRVASPNSNAVLSADYNAGANQLGTLAVPNTGGWQNWTTISQTVTLPAGSYNLGVFAQVGGFNLNWINVVANGSSNAGPSGYTWCAAENGSYTFSQAVDVAYGANGSFAYKTGVTGTIAFNNATFGDPIPGIVKAGYYKAGAAGATTVYSDCSFSGNAVSLGEGSYTLSSLLAKGIKNDDISSLKVASGYHAVLYGDDNFSGPSMVTGADTSCLVDRGFNDIVSSMKVLSNNVAVPPATWQEHWFEHNQLLSLVYQDQDVAIYFDGATPRNITWMNQYCGDVWRYTKKVYGDLDGGGDDQRLYAIFHTGQYGGGHPSYYFDASHDYRDVLDIGAGPWDSMGGWNLDATTHEVSHIVESATNNAQGSPCFALWHDSKWAEIYIYDVYVGLGRTDDAARAYNNVINGSDSYPVAGTQWFKNWFYPIWNGYGHSAVLSRFFQLMSQNFPKNGKTYARDMNWGEFVHFWSGAAGADLRNQASIAFGWPSDWEQQFQQAKKDFPNLHY